MNPEAESLREEIALLRRQLARERSSREQAEQLAEQGTRALYDRQAELTLLHTIATAANSSATLHSAAATVLRALAEFGGWELGHIYLSEPGSDALVSLGLWHEAKPGRCTAFVAASEGQSFRRGVGLPGRVMQRGEFLLLPDLAAETNFPRREEALACGLVSGLAFPITPSLGGMAVIELFSIRAHSEDEALLRLLPQVTAQTARIFARHWIERERERIQSELETKVRERTEELSRTVKELRDLVEQQRITQQSLQVRDRALNAAANGIVIADAQQAGLPIIYCNPAFERLTGYRADEVLGRNCKMLQGDGTEIETVAELRGAIQQGEACSVIIRNYRKDGSTFWNRLTIAPVRDASDQLTHFIGVQEDVSRQREIETNLRAARDASEQANQELSHAARMKDEFLAAMSHELRTPLNTVLGMTEILREQFHGPLNEQQADMVVMVEESGRHLLALINDILDLSKIEAGKLELHPEEVAVRPLAEGCVRLLREQALRKRLALSVQVEPGLEILVADQRRLKQVLVNLLSNAVKFTPEEGRVMLEVRSVEHTREVCFTVSDTGIGISRPDIERIFQPFVQIDSRLARRYEGTGLGLALVRRMVEMHDGRVTVESEPGKGSRFHVFLPLAGTRHSPAPGMTEPDPISVPAPVAKMSLLLAEDHEANRRMLGDYLHSLGHQVTMATNGEEACQRAAEVEPDIILMDVQMPGMDGLEAIRRLRAEPRTADIPIVVLTALAMNGDRDRCLMSGANHYVSKPIVLSELAALLNRMATDLTATKV